MKKHLLILCLMLVFFGTQTVSAQDVFLQGTYIEVGVSEGGSLGTSNDAPSNFNLLGRLGFIADVDKDGWTIGTPKYVGDYFMPGSPEEGWSLEWTTGGNEYNFNNVFLEGEYDMPVLSHLNKSFGDYRISEWIGSAAKGDGTDSLQIKQLLRFHKDSLQFSFTITLKNVGSTLLESLEYMRNLDPDQEEPITGDYTTRNYVKYQPGVGSNTDTAMVVAEALSYTDYKMIIASINSNAVVSTEGFDNRDPDEILDSPNAPSKSSPEEADQAIVIAYRFGNLAPGDSIVFTYFYILKEEQIAVVTPNTINISSTTPANFCPATTTPVNVVFDATGPFNAGNIFTAQLSGPTGSFASPTTIGTLTATNSGTISASIPSGMATGEGYRIRVISSNPAFIGNDNGTNIAGGVFISAPNVSRCGTGTLTLDASSTSGTIDWYAGPSSGPSIHTGSSYTTSSLSTTTPYYVEAVDGACTSSRIAVQAIVSSGTPTITSSTDGTVCGNGKVIVQATASNGTVKWYDDETTGTLVYTGNNFQTPLLSQGTTITYYAEADNGCLSTSRTAVDAIAYAIPYIDDVNDNYRCFEGSLSIEVEPYPSSTTVTWYADAVGGTSIYTGATYTTPSLSEDTEYYVMLDNNGCVATEREEIEAEIIVPEVTQIFEGTSCGPGTVELEVNYNGDDAFWYDVPTSGTILVTDDDYTTPSISTTTTYYVEVVDEGCVSPTRTAVRAIIGNGTPVISATTPGIACTSEGTATVSAEATDAIITWYDDETAGNELYTGNDFNITNISGDTTFFAEANNGCGVSARTAVAVTFTVCTGVQNATSAIEMSVFPNPNQGNFEILTGKITEGTMDLIDNTGRTLLSGEFHNGKIIVEKPELDNGLYIVRIKKDDRMAFQKIVINK